MKSSRTITCLVWTCGVVVYSEEVGGSSAWWPQDLAAAPRVRVQTVEHTHRVGHSKSEIYSM